MRILILDHYYSEFLRWHYDRRPGLEKRDYDEQASSLGSELFGETAFEVAALQALGHQALFIPVNAAALIEAWLLGQGIRIPRRRSLKVVRRHGVPWPTTDDRVMWLYEALQAVADSYRPDVIHVQCLDGIPAALVRSLKASGRMISGQSATPAVPWDDLDMLDSFVPALPTYVEKATGQGVSARYLALAFDAELINRVGDIVPRRDVAFSFVGALSNYHRRRLELLIAISNRYQVDVWSPDVETIDIFGPSIRFHGTAWGRAMYDVLSRSMATLNVHGDFASGYAANLRMFEATGMGAVLVTEEASNLAELFNPGSEVVTYRDVDELVAVVGHLLAHPDEAAEIAARGQARTLRDHTWKRRMAQLVEILEQHRESQTRE